MVNASGGAVEGVAAEVQLGPPDRTARWLLPGAIGGVIGGGFVVARNAGLAMSTYGLLLGLTVVACVYIIGAVAVAQFRIRRFLTASNLAIGALGRGELAKAHARFVRGARSSNDVISAMARHNLGWTLMLEQRVEEAATILADAAEHHRPALARVGVLATTRADLALCHALLGNLDVAETWCARAQEPVKGPLLPTFPAMLAIVRAVIACRRGRTAEAMASLEDAWVEHEATMTGEMLRMMRVLRAFACAAADGPRNQGLVERVLGDMKPRYERELAFLGSAWPEMATFLSAHELEC